MEVATAFSDTVVDAIRANGQIEAVQSIDVQPEITGRLTQILAREGREVAAGTPLFKVDDAELRAEVARLEQPDADPAIEIDLECLISEESVNA